jgi:hypothetical protein
MTDAPNGTKARRLPLLLLLGALALPLAACGEEDAAQGTSGSGGAGAEGARAVNPPEPAGTEPDANGSLSGSAQGGSVPSAPQPEAGR